MRKQPLPPSKTQTNKKTAVAVVSAEHVAPKGKDRQFRTDAHLMRVSLIFAVVALTLPAALYHGRVLQRWNVHEDLQAYVAALAAVPQKAGYWVHHSDGKPISDGLQKQLEIHGYIHRVYEHEVTGQKVTMLLLVGPAGPLVRHPPEICYQTRANKMLESQMLTVEIKESRAANLRLLSYESASKVDGDFYVAYTFGCRREWDTPASPRLAFGGELALYKLHVLTDIEGGSADDSPEGLIDFIQQMLPELNQLVPAT